MGRDVKRCEGDCVFNVGDEPASLFVCSVVSVWGVVCYVGCFLLLCEFCFLYCNDVYVVVLC